MHLRVGRTRRNKEWFGGNSFPWGKSSFQACFSTGDSRPEPKLWAESARMIPHAAPLGITVCCNATLVPGLRRQKPSFYDQPAAIFANQNFQKTRLNKLRSLTTKLIWNESEMSLKWASNESQMSLKWASNETQVSLKWASNEPQMSLKWVSNGS